MRIKLFPILFFIFTANFSYSIEPIDDKKIVHEIADILIKEYSNYKDRTVLEQLALSLGKKMFIDSVKNWEDNYNDIEGIKIKLHPRIEGILKTGEKYLPPERALYFRELFSGLTLLGYKNLQIYYKGVKAEFENSGYREITLKLIDESITMPRYFENKKELYREEESIKNNIRIIFREGKLKNKLALYAMVFDFFDNIRKQIIEKDMKKMQEKISKKEQDKVK